MSCPHCHNEPRFSGPHPEGMLKLHHPLAGHGFAPETGWTHPEAKRLHEEEAEALKSANASHAAPKRAPEATHGA